jgi:hypothetical protein
MGKLLRFIKSLMQQEYSSNYNYKKKPVIFKVTGFFVFMIYILKANTPLF